MASPAVVNTQAHALSTAATSYNGGLPASLVAGRLLLGYIAVDTKDANPITMPAGWTIFLDTIADGGTRRTFWVWKAVTGSEGATALITNGTTASRFCFLTWQISGAADPTVQPPQVSTPATGTSTTWDATAVVPTGGSKDYLFVCAFSGIPTTSTTVPTNYGNRTTVGNTASSAAGCYRQATTASEDPGTWALSPSGTWLATVVAVHPPSNVPMAIPLGGVETPNPEEDVTPALLVARSRNIGQAIEEDETLALVAVIQGSDLLIETFNVGDGPLGQADLPWLRLAGGTRWQTITQQGAFVGSAFGSEGAMCLRPINSDSYSVKFNLAGWQLGSANDISLGIMVRKSSDPADLTFLSAFLTKGPTVNRVQLWRTVAGVASMVEFNNIPASVEGQEFEVKVFKGFGDSTRLEVHANHVKYIDFIDTVIDPLITSGRYFGLVGYLQGGTGDTVLRVDTVTATVIVPPTQGGLVYLVGRHRMVFGA